MRNRPDRKEAETHPHRKSNRLGRLLNNFKEIEMAIYVSIKSMDAPLPNTVRSILTDRGFTKSDRPTVGVYVEEYSCKADTWEHLDGIGNLVEELNSNGFPMEATFNEPDSKTFVAMHPDVGTVTKFGKDYDECLGEDA